MFDNKKYIHNRVKLKYIYEKLKMYTKEEKTTKACLSFL